MQNSTPPGREKRRGNTCLARAKAVVVFFLKAKALKVIVVR